MPWCAVPVAGQALDSLCSIHPDKARLVVVLDLADILSQDWPDRLLVLYIVSLAGVFLLNILFCQVSLQIKLKIKLNQFNQSYLFVYFYNYLFLFKFEQF